MCVSRSISDKSSPRRVRASRRLLPISNTCDPPRTVWPQNPRAARGDQAFGLGLADRRLLRATVAPADDLQNSAQADDRPSLLPRNRADLDALCGAQQLGLAC